jgi:hypothetical protein
MAGIRCVESIVAWILYVGKDRAEPPAFMWRGDNYLVRMYSDLDFVGPELISRGISIAPEFKKSNPLLIQPNQRLGRARAAMTIISEMVEIAKTNTVSLPNRAQLTHITHKDCSNTQDPLDSIAISSNRSRQIIHPPIKPTSPRIHLHQNDNKPETRGNALQLLQNDIQNESTINKSRTMCDQIENNGLHDLVYICSHEKTQLFDLPYEANMEKETHSISYDPAKTGDDNKPKTIEPQALVCEKDMSCLKNDETKVNDDDDVYSDFEGDSDEAIANQVTLMNESDAIPEKESRELKIDYKTFENTHVTELKYALEKLNIPESKAQVVLSQVMDNRKTSAVDLLVDLHRGILENVKAVASTVIHFDSLLKLLATNIVEHIDKAIQPICQSLFLWIQNKECQNICEIKLGDILEFIDNSVETQLKDEVLDSALSLAQHCISKRDVQCFQSSSLTQLFQFLYPFFMSTSRLGLSQACCDFIKSLCKLVDVSSYSFLICAVPKSILLIANLSSREDYNSSNLSKLQIVCDRSSPLDSSILALNRTNGWGRNFELYPFFKSEYGGKVVNGVRVEAGEGRGPLKEWFNLVSRAFCNSWRALSCAESSIEASIDVENRSLFGACLVQKHQIKVGNRFDILLEGQNTTTYTVVKIVATDEVLLDRPYQSSERLVLTPGQYQWFVPEIPILVYIQESECYWLNEHAKQTEEMLARLRFFGWTLSMVNKVQRYH